MQLSPLRRARRSRRRRLLKIGPKLPPIGGPWGLRTVPAIGCQRRHPLRRRILVQKQRATTRERALVPIPIAAQAQPARTRFSSIGQPSGLADVAQRFFSVDDDHAAPAGRLGPKSGLPTEDDPEIAGVSCLIELGFNLALSPCRPDRGGIAELHSAISSQ